MKNKYVMVSGFAFSEETDMEKLSGYARKGWVLEGISRVFFYKLKKDTPQDIIYSVDYQKEATEEYFELFSQAGWRRVTSIGNEIHIFSAPADTKPIYSERDTELEKYVDVKNKTAKGSIYSLVSIAVSMALMVLSVAFIRQIFIFTLLLFIISIIAFVFNFMSYLAYNSRLKGKGNTENKNKLKLVSSICFLIAGIMNIISRNYGFAAMFLVIGIFDADSVLKSYKRKS